MHKEIDIKKLQFNPFTLIGNEWMLIAAGNGEKHNMMTASWGGLGFLWEKNVATVYIRPTRYTINFVEKEECFTLNFFGKNRAPYKVGGGVSGRDTDKAREAGLTPVFDYGTVYYEEAGLVLVCKKLYHSQFDNKNFVDPQIESFYNADYHKIFIGEIIAALQK